MSIMNNIYLFCRCFRYWAVRGRLTNSVRTLSQKDTQLTSSCTSALNDQNSIKKPKSSEEDWNVSQSQQPAYISRPMYSVAKTLTGQRACVLPDFQKINSFLVWSIRLYTIYIVCNSKFNLISSFVCLILLQSFPSVHWRWWLADNKIISTLMLQ